VRFTCLHFSAVLCQEMFYSALWNRSQDTFLQRVQIKIFLMDSFLLFQTQTLFHISESRHAATKVILLYNSWVAQEQSRGHAIIQTGTRICVGCNYPRKKIKIQFLFTFLFPKCNISLNFPQNLWLEYSIL
jgi:hypothetical protein